MVSRTEERRLTPLTHASWVMRLPTNITKEATVEVVDCGLDKLPKPCFISLPKNTKKGRERACLDKRLSFEHGTIVHALIPYKIYLLSNKDHIFDKFALAEVQGVLCKTVTRPSYWSQWNIYVDHLQFSVLILQLSSRFRTETLVQPRRLRPRQISIVHSIKAFRGKLFNSLTIWSIL